MGMRMRMRRRHGAPARDDWMVGALVAWFLALRALAVRTTPIAWVDSPEYRHLAFVGGRRPFTVPLLFWLVPSDKGRVIEQAVISAGAWIVLALVVGATLVDRRVRLAAIATILALGLTTQVTSWDSTILSDSITISLTVLLIAAWIAVRRTPSYATVAAVLAATLLWTFARELHFYITAIVAVVVVEVVVIRGSSNVWRLLAAGLVVIAALGLAESRANDETSTQNLAGVIGVRILPDHDARQWFVAAGMPPLLGLEEGKEHSAADVQHEPGFNEWASSKGWFTLARYLVEHPAAALSGPFGDLLEERPTTFEPRVDRPVLLSPADAYGRARVVLPPAVEDVLFDPGGTGALLALAALAFVGTVVLDVRQGRDPRRLVPGVVIGASVAYVVVSWHGSVLEIGRHAVPGAVAVRVGIFVVLALLADRALGGVGEPEG
jgi:hypothetical protein